jgi:GcrA cell cycle regulator
MSWTDERVELLKKLWLEGLSASAIATELGSGVSRNAVIGKVHRLGLSGRAKAPAQAAPRRTKPTRTPTHPMRAASTIPFARGNAALAADIATDVAPEPEPERRPAEEVVIPLSERVTIMELRESMCRWPIGDPGREDFRFCGAKSSVGVPYCAHHAAIAYQPVMDRRRDRDRRAARG